VTDHDVPPDAIVRTALQLLPIPAHEDGFWARLERSLDDAGTPTASPAVQRSAVVATPDPAVNGRSAPRGDASPADPVVLQLEHDPALALVPRALRRTSNVLLVAVAAAAVVVVAIAGNTLLEERNGTSDVTAGDNEASATLDKLVDDAQPDSVTPSTLSPDSEDATSEAVLTWVDDLGAGDGDGAWQAMGPTSQAHFGSQAAFEEELSALAEGYGAWSAAEPDEVLVTPILASDEGTIAVVTLVGTVEQEGSSQHRADAFPVRLVDGDAVLEPFAFAGELEVVVPEGVPSEGVRPPVAAGEELVIVVPSDAEAPVLRLDDGETLVCGVADGTELTELDTAPGQRCSYLPPDGMDAGEHLLTVAFMGADGASISAASLLFDAA
jgi:hypothetical protein